MNDLAQTESVPPRQVLAAVERIRPSLWDLLSVSLALGSVGFGGGISVLSNIRQTAVDRRHWLTEREFTNAATVAQMLPGGAAANALAYIGLRFFGVPGALICYAGFIFPGMVLVLLLAWAYVRFGATPHAETLLAGVNAAVVGIVAAITLRMLRSSIARLWQMGVAASALLLTVAGGASSGEVAFLGIGAGLAVDLGMERARLRRFRDRAKKPSPPVALPDEGAPLPHAKASQSNRITARAPAFVALAAGLALWATGYGGAIGDLTRIAIVFFRTGLGAYGGGFAIVPHLQLAMHASGWLSQRQFADAVAIGKLTPGPVLLMATFIGYVKEGLPGALVATVAIFSAPFGLVALLGTWLDRVRSRRWVRAALRGLTPAVVGLMAAAALTLGSSLQGAVEGAIAGSVALAMERFDLNPAWMLAFSGAVRIALRLLVHI